MLNPKQSDGTPIRPGMGGSEKKKLILMSLALGLVVIAYVASLLQSDSSGGSIDPSVPRFEDEIVESVSIPEIDAASIEATVKDREDVERVVLERGGLDAIQRYVRLLTDRHYEAMEAAEIDDELCASLLAEPSAFRARPFVVRGRIAALRTRPSPAGTEEHIGRLEIDGGRSVYFLAQEVPDVSSTDAWLRVDGLFLKAFRDEDPDRPGEWIEGPFVVGRRALRSHAPLGEVAALDDERIASLVDDQLVSPDGRMVPTIHEPPFEALWHVMAYVRDLPEDAIDWSEVPELDRTTMYSLAQDGAPYRLRPFRFPKCRLQGARVKRAVENPARLPVYTEGWIGNAAWKNVAHFVGPFENRDLALRDYVTAYGFYLRTFAYDSSGQGIQVAPTFVLVAVDEFEPAADPIFAKLALAMAAVTVSLLLLFSFLVARDKKRGEALQDEIVRRRRERQRRHAVGNATT